MAFGTGTVANIGGAVSDLFSASALKTKAKGSMMEAEEYSLAGTLARQNEQFEKTSTDIKEMQSQRDALRQIGSQEAGIASGGGAFSGSSLDILRDSASQAALTKAVIGQQGLINEAGYEEQAKSYDLMKDASIMAAKADKEAATGAYIGAGFKAVGAVTSLFTGGAPGGGPGGGGA
jgi:hypothetical protein